VLADEAAARTFLQPDPELLDAAVWQAGRQGLTDRLVDPESGVLLPARDVVRMLLRYIRPALEDEGESAWVDASIERLFATGTGAERQRKAMESGGLTALMNLYATSLTAEP